MKKTVALIFDKNQADLLIRKVPSKINIYPMTPDVFFYLRSKKIKKIINPFNLNYDLINRKIVNELMNIENNFESTLNRKKDIPDYNRESIKNIFHVFASSSLFLWFKINEFNSFYIYNENKWEITNNKKIVFLNLNKYIYKHLIVSFNLVEYKSNFFSKLAFTFINNYNLSRLKKNVILTSGYVYGIKKIARNIISNNKNISIFHLENFDKNLFKIILSYFFRKKLDSQTRINLLYKDKLNFDYSEKLNFLNNLNSIPIKIISKDIINFIKICLKNSDASNEYLSFLLKKTKPKIIITHHQRWLQSVVLSSLAYKMNIPVYLISHGSHTYNKNKYIKFVNKYLSKGMISSPFSKYVVYQSPNTNSNILNNRKTKILKSLPIMWGNINIKKLENDSNTQYILHAGTAKLYSTRAWIYENYFEYLNGINLLIKSVLKMKNVKLIVRLRPIEGCNIESIKKYLIQSDKIIFKTDGLFEEDLKKSCLLVSYCSTTIEESLYSNKPVAIFGGSERYRHLQGSLLLPKINKRYAVYILNNKNIDIMLKNILKFHNNNALLSKQELKGYIWQKNKNEFNNSIRKYLNE